MYGDFVLAAVLALSMLGELAATDVLPGKPAIAVLALLGTLPLTYRRRMPLASFVVMWSALLSMASQVAGLTDNSVTYVALVFVTLYSLGAHARRAAVWAGAVLVLAGIILFVATDGDPFAVGDVLFGTVIIGGPWAAGVAIRLRRDRERELS